MLRKALPEDLDFIYGLYMHPLVNPWLLYEQMGKDEFVPVYNDLLEKDIKYVFYANNMNAGMVKIIPYTYRAAHTVYIGGLAVHPDFKGHGYGKQLITDTIGFCRERGFLRLELSVAVVNKKAISLYEQAGFREEGVLKKYTWLASEGRFVDESLMALLF